MGTRRRTDRAFRVGGSKSDFGPSVNCKVRRQKRVTQEEDGDDDDEMRGWREADGRSSSFRRRDVNARQNGLALLVVASGSLSASSLASRQFTRLGVCMWKIDSTKSV
uniref:Uncharacterized protein n=1 Tax=Peronospora matthiolae TaxID=2874970 RepID=A0AAV1U918_9STRA